MTIPSEQRSTPSITCPTARIVRSDKQVEDVLRQVMAAQDSPARTQHPGRSYEDGIEEMWNWLTGLQNGQPMEQDCEEEEMEFDGN